MPGCWATSLMPIYPGQIDTIWEETRKTMRLQELRADYFSSNREPVETQLAKISSIVQEYEVILVSGLDDPTSGCGMRKN